MADVTHASPHSLAITRASSRTDLEATSSTGTPYARSACASRSASAPYPNGIEKRPLLTQRYVEPRRVGLTRAPAALALDDAAPEGDLANDRADRLVQRAAASDEAGRRLDRGRGVEAAMSIAPVPLVPSVETIERRPGDELSRAHAQNERLQDLTSFVDPRSSHAAAWASTSRRRRRGTSMAKEICGAATRRAPSSTDHHS